MVFALMAEKKEIKVEIVEERQMSDAEVETFASLLFQWWKRDFEKQESHNDSIQESGEND